MKTYLFSFIALSGLLLYTSSCSNSSESNLYAADQEQELGENQIINIMMTVDKGEISAAKEAVKKTKKNSVEKYAKYLISQHQENLDQLTQLANKLGIESKESEISKSLQSNSKDGLNKLSGLKGQAFDRAFIDAMVKDHRDGLELINSKLLPQTTNPKLKEALEQFKNMVTDHLDKGIEIQKIL